MSSFKLTEKQIVQNLKIAYRLALRSPDNSTQNGALALDDNLHTVGRGWNDFTKGIVPTQELLVRPKKYNFIEHAERNAIFDCLNNVGRPRILFASWAACADCARAIIQSGIKLLVRHKVDVNHRWAESMVDGDRMMVSAGIKIINYTNPLGDCDPVLFDGKMWTP